MGLQLITGASTPHPSTKFKVFRMSYLIHLMFLVSVSRKKLAIAMTSVFARPSSDCESTHFSVNFLPDQCKEKMLPRTRWSAKKLCANIAGKSSDYWISQLLTENRGNKALYRYYFYYGLYLISSIKKNICSTWFSFDFPVFCRFCQIIVHAFSTKKNSAKFSYTPTSTKLTVRRFNVWTTIPELRPTIGVPRPQLSAPKGAARWWKIEGFSKLPLVH